MGLDVVTQDMAPMLLLLWRGLPGEEQELGT